MGILIAIVVGAACGVGQFFLRRAVLRPLAEGKDIPVAKVLFFQMPIPFVLLLGCALVNAELLPFAGGAFCLCLVAASVVNHMVTIKKKG